MFDLSSNLPPYCYGNLDQTNCTDVYKVGGHCLINGYMSSVSKYVVYDSPLVENPANLCDDNLDSECILPSEYTSCVVHKHKLCDGISDCEDSSDETLDICQLTTVGYFNCKRSFNPDRNMEIPVSWLSDNQSVALA